MLKYNIFLIFLVLINIIIILNADKIIKKINIYDNPDGKLKIHKKKTAPIGWIIYLFNFIIFVIFDYISQANAIDNIFHLSSKSQVFSFYFGIFSFIIIGFVDDIKGIAPIKRTLYAITIFFLVLKLNSGLLVQNFDINFLNLTINTLPISTGFTILCIWTLFNMLNMYDGINLQSGINFIIIFTFFYFKFNQEIIYLVFIISSLFFLILNSKSKLFLGNTGIYFLSYIIFFIILKKHNVSHEVNAEELMLLLIIPFLDIVRVMCTRLLKLKKVYAGDLNHIHHRLISKYKLIPTNIILAILSGLPIILHYWKIFPIYYLIYGSIIVYYLIICLTKKISSNL